MSHDSWHCLTIRKLLETLKDERSPCICSREGPIYNNETHPMKPLSRYYSNKSSALVWWIRPSCTWTTLSCTSQDPYLSKAIYSQSWNLNQKTIRNNVQSCQVGTIFWNQEWLVLLEIYEVLLSCLSSSVIFSSTYTDNWHCGSRPRTRKYCAPVGRDPRITPRLSRPQDKWKILEVIIKWQRQILFQITWSQPTYVRNRRMVAFGEGSE